MSVAMKALTTILDDKAVNRNANDVMFYGWVGPPRVWQYGLDVREARRVIAKIKTIRGREDQQAVLKGLFELQQEVRGFPGSAKVRLSESAATALTAFGESIGLPRRFSFGQARAHAPLAAVG